MTVDELTPRRREILEAALALVERGGLEALTMRALADSLGMRAPSLYKHFPDKASLEAGLAAIGLEAFAEWLERADPSLSSVAREYRAFALARPELYRLLTARRLPRERLPADLERRAAAPVISAVGDPDLARAVWAFAHGMAILELSARFPEGADLDAAWGEGVRAFEASISHVPVRHKGNGPRRQ